MPTRLIDISDRDNMLLVEGVTKRSHYFALSHRWIEASKMPRCVSSNIGSLKKNIPWSALTRNFQDAIPIRYVWIDSLCIVQDSVADWDAESKLMCSVYEGALLTVAAAAGPDGCFAAAERKSLRPPSRLDLMTRGWVMQERLLSRRFIVFAPNEGEHAARNLRNWWRRLVERYTTLDLTQESDRLPAIMGLAIQYGRWTGQEMKGYLAGI
ncbi:hypothetical protein BDP81DRAFT_480780 [Colletotrichum phormii]|uniref:Heterokaryon incompatibility domain-containing protein n=1 Tax=Colletotrichum phormii TaxID=359342 RepID=A0AAI9ZTM7_9PEZI|nr:uncharacterized protein BDP81DRAFT_480780 [Colletotrichum phormii]KAK1637951.1 hypothetical protein BDP81DRAFT_480780 [Colletotrichum phormii]